MTNFEKGLFSADECARIHSVALRILEKVGVKVDDAGVHSRLLAAGARAGSDPAACRMPREMVAEALALAPREARLADRRGRVTVVAPGGPSLFWTGAALRRVDGPEGRAARIDRSWLARFARLVDALPHTHAVVGTAMEDCPPAISDFTGFRILAEATSKHLRPLMFSPRGGEAILEMGRVLAGGGTLRERPVFSVGYSIVSPLHWEAAALGLFRGTAGHGIPVMINSEPMAGGSAPVTLAGAVALGHAEALSGLVINQLLEPGRPCIYNLGFAHVMEMRHATALTGAPENGLFGAASAGLARFLGLPSASWMCTEALAADAQAAYEKALTGQMHAAAGVNVIWGVGQLESELALSMEQAVIDDEIAGMILRGLRGIPVNDEHLAEDLILSKGFDGFYLDEDHTLRHYREEVYRAQLSFRDRRGSWEQAGRQDAFHRAHERVGQLLAAPAEPALAPEAQRELAAIEAHFTDVMQEACP